MEGLVRENERRLEKLSLRKQLKLKCQEQNSTPINDKALVTVGTDAEIFQPNTVLFYGQPCEQTMALNHSTVLPAKRSFHARVTERLFEGYTIETVIDGKPLRGVLFSNKLDIINTTAPNSSRKRAVSEADGVVSNGGCNINSKEGVSQEAIDKRLPVTANAKESASHEAARGQVTASPVQQVIPVNLGDNNTNNAPKSNTEGLGDDQTEVSTSSKEQVFRRYIVDREDVGFIY